VTGSFTIHIILLKNSYCLKPFVYQTPFNPDTFSFNVLLRVKNIDKDTKFMQARLSCMQQQNCKYHGCEKVGLLRRRPGLKGATAKLSASWLWEGGAAEENAWTYGSYSKTVSIMAVGRWGC
jgi:hypothetical protein